MTDQQPGGLIRLLSIQTVAKNLGVSIRTVRRWIELEMIPVYRLGRTVRISAGDVEVFLARHRSETNNNNGRKLE
ncbi:MAG: helix-turn-helix domain-containing protein [Alphaproteobacteria bacterium]|nr:helix-turn-helix domain-containing protein [Alphaproteobacteria bacterium]